MHDPCADEVPGPGPVEGLDIFGRKQDEDVIPKKCPEGEGKTEALECRTCQHPPPHHDRVETKERGAQERQEGPQYDHQALTFSAISLLTQSASMLVSGTYSGAFSSCSRSFKPHIE